MKLKLNHFIYMSINLVIGLMFLSTELLSNDELPSMVVLDLPDLINPSDEGSYGNVFNALVENSLIKNWSVEPTLRARRRFINKEFDCIAPVTKLFMMEHNLLDEGYNINASFNNIISYLLINDMAKNRIIGEKPLLGAAFKGKQYGIEKNKYKTVVVRSYHKIFHLLKENRIDAAYIILPDALSDPDAREHLDDFRGQKIILAQNSDLVICHNNYSKHIQTIADRFTMWRKNGKLSQLLGKYHFTD